MRIFKCDEEIKTYKAPVIKITICVCVIVLLCFNPFHVNNVVANICVTVLCFCVFMLAVLCIYVSIAEILLLNERRAEQNTQVIYDAQKAEVYSIDSIVSLLVKNDIIKISIVFKNSKVVVEASADSKPGTKAFFDKKYYINDNEVTIDVFKK